ncbi:MAG: hypothetical protein U0R50_03770 [Gaiellales bacterium]
MAVFWIAVAVFTIGVIAGLAFAVLRGLALWRQVKRSGGAIGAEADRIGAAAASISDQLERASASSAALAEASERLARSRAQLAVQQAAIREARLAVKRALWFLPGV